MLYSIIIYVIAGSILTFVFLFFINMYKKEQVLHRIYSNLPDDVISNLEEEAKYESRNVEQQIAYIIKKYYQ